MASFVVLLVGLLIVSAEAIYPCNPCRGDKCEVDPKSCIFGAVRLCGQQVCARGPGMRCGGYMSIRGKCADGLTCNNCGYCSGCLRDGSDCYRSDIIKCYTEGRK